MSSKPRKKSDFFNKGKEINELPLTSNDLLQRTDQQLSNDNCNGVVHLNRESNSGIWESKVSCLPEFSSNGRDNERIQCLTPSYQEKVHNYDNRYNVQTCSPVYHHPSSRRGLDSGLCALSKENQATLSNAHPGTLSDDHPGSLSNAHPGTLSDAHPGTLSNAHPGTLSNAHPGTLSDAHPGTLSNAHPGTLSDAHPGTHVLSDDHPGTLSDAHPGTLSNAHPGTLSNAHPGTLSDAHPGMLSDAHPGTHALSDDHPGTLSDEHPAFYNSKRTIEYVEDIDRFNSSFECRKRQKRSSAPTSAIEVSPGDGVTKSSSQVSGLCHQSDTGNCNNSLYNNEHSSDVTVCESQLDAQPSPQYHTRPPVPPRNTLSSSRREHDAAEILECDTSTPATAGSNFNQNSVSFFHVNKEDISNKELYAKYQHEELNTSYAKSYDVTTPVEGRDGGIQKSSLFSSHISSLSNLLIPLGQEKIHGSSTRNSAFPGSAASSVHHQRRPESASSPQRTTMNSGSPPYMVRSAFVPITPQSSVVPLATEHSPPTPPPPPPAPAVVVATSTSLSPAEGSISSSSSPDSPEDGKKRTQTCRLCQNHGIETAIKGHKYFCSFKDCKCENCQITFNRRYFVKKQLRLTRHQNSVKSPVLLNVDYGTLPDSNSVTNDTERSAGKESHIAIKPFPMKAAMIKDLAQLDCQEFYDKITSICRPKLSD